MYGTMAQGENHYKIETRRKWKYIFSNYSRSMDGINVVVEVIFIQKGQR